MRPALYSGSSIGRLPMPTRAQILQVKQTFQGLWVPTSYGTLPWFDPAVLWLPAGDRSQVYAAKHAAGDTHFSVAVSGQYREPNTPYYNIPGQDFTQRLDTFHGLVKDIIDNGFYVLVHCAGDGSWSPADPNGYNDPVGLTKGWPWLMNNFANIVNHLWDLAPWIVYVPGFDGCFPTWSPSQSFQWFARARAILGPTDYLGFEMGLGAGGGAYSHFGGGAGDYLRADVQGNDLWLQEWGNSPQGDDLWQTAARMLGPAYNRPADQPAGDDPNPPFYLAPGTPRGPYVTCGWEWREYQFTHGFGDATSAAIAADRQRLRAIGYTALG